MSVDAQRIRDARDVEAFLVGLSLFGTGGGGKASWGRGYLQALLEEGHEVRWHALVELDPGVTTLCTTFGMGSVAPRVEMTLEERQALGYGERVVERPAAIALAELGKRTDRRIGAVFPFELGPFNTILAIDAALRSGIPVVDGDLMGRALPELCQTLPAVRNMPIFPLVICDSWGCIVAIEDAVSAVLAERLGKAISTVTKLPDMTATCAHAGFLMSRPDAREVLVEGTLTRSLETGRAISAAIESGADVGTVAAAATGGRLVFEGVVAQRDWSDTNGYMIGTTELDGVDVWRGSYARIWFKNENHLLWLDDQFTASSPDLICVALQSGVSKTNTELTVGDHVAVIVVPADPRYREGVALTANSPRHYGFDLDYIGGSDNGL